MYLHTMIPLPPPEALEQRGMQEMPESHKHSEEQDDRVWRHEQAMRTPAEEREERLREADVPSMADFFHVSRLPHKQRT